MEELDQKTKIIEMLSKLQNPEILDRLEKLLFKLRYEEESLTPMTIEQFDIEMQMSLNDLSNNRIISSEDLKKEMLTW